MEAPLTMAELNMANYSYRAGIFVKEKSTNAPSHLPTGAPQSKHIEKLLFFLSL